MLDIARTHTQTLHCTITVVFRASAPILDACRVYWTLTVFFFFFKSGIAHARVRSIQGPVRWSLSSSKALSSASSLLSSTSRRISSRIRSLRCNGAAYLGVCPGMGAFQPEQIKRYCNGALKAEVSKISYQILQSACWSNNRQRVDAYPGQWKLR